MGNVKFDVSKRIDLRNQVQNEMRAKMRDVRYELPKCMKPEIREAMEQYYGGGGNFIDLADVHFFSDAQRIRSGILSETVLKNMESGFDVNKYSRPIDIVKYHHGGKTYNICVDGQGRCAFAYINGIGKMRCNVISETNDWDEVCRIPMSINDKANYQQVSKGQKFEMLLNQGCLEVVRRHNCLKSIFAGVVLPSQKKAGKRSSPQGVFGTTADWSNYLWRVNFRDDGMDVEKGCLDPDEAAECYAAISSKFNGGKSYPNWYRTFNAINRILKKGWPNLRLADVLDFDARPVDRNNLDTIDQVRYNYVFIDSDHLKDIDLGIMLLKLCKKYGIVKKQYKKKFLGLGKSMVEILVSNMEQSKQKTAGV